MPQSLKGTRFDQGSFEALNASFYCCDRCSYRIVVLNTGAHFQEDNVALPSIKRVFDEVSLQLENEGL
jgi:hypothetical protein